MNKIKNILIIVGLIIGTMLFVFIVESFLLFLFTGILQRITLYSPEIYIMSTFMSLITVFAYLTFDKDLDDLFY